MLLMWVWGSSFPRLSQERRCEQAGKLGKVGKSKKKEKGDQDIHSNYLRTSDCKWCGRVYNSAFKCSGCGKQWKSKSVAEHCLAHCSQYCAASAKDRGEMVLKGQNCMICLHHEHDTNSCFGKGQQKTVCGLEECSSVSDTGCAGCQTSSQWWVW